MIDHQDHGGSTPCPQWTSEWLPLAFDRPLLGVARPLAPETPQPPGRPWALPAMHHPKRRTEDAGLAKTNLAGDTT